MEMSINNKLELHFELTHIGTRNVKDIVNQWQQIYDNSPEEAVWTVIQLFVDSTGYLDKRLNLSRQNLTVKNFKTIISKISTKNFSNEKFILYSSSLRENVTKFVRELVLANYESEYFIEPYTVNVMMFLFQLVKKHGDVFYTIGSLFLMQIMCTLLDIAQLFDGNGINNVIKKYAHGVFGHIVRCLEFENCAFIMCGLFLNAFEKFQQSFLRRIDIKKIFLTMLEISDSHLIMKILKVIKNVLEKAQINSEKGFMLDLFSSKEIMAVLIHDALGTNKRNSLMAHEIINIILNESETKRTSGIQHHDYTSLLFRMYDINPDARILAGNTFLILNNNKNIIRKMIIFHLQYPKYCDRLSHLVEACCYQSNQIESYINELVLILSDADMPDVDKVVGGKILLELYKRLSDCGSSLVNLLERISELLSVTKDVPHVTLNLFEIVTHDITDADASTKNQIIEFLSEFITSHNDYDLLCAANNALYTVISQRGNILIDNWSHASVVQSIHNDYELSRSIMPVDPEIYQTCLIRFLAATEFVKCIYEYFDDFQRILDTLFTDLKVDGTSDAIREHQIILYTTLLNAAFAKTKSVEIVERAKPFLEYLITILADSTDDLKLNTLVASAVIPGICNFYIIASHPVDPVDNINRIQIIPSFVYSNIGNSLGNISATVSDAESNMRAFKILLEYWITLHKVQKIPKRPEANKILFLYGNVEQLAEPLESLLMCLYNMTSDHGLMIASIGYSFVQLQLLQKPMARNYTNSLYKFLTRKTTKIEEEDVLKLIAAIFKYMLNAMEKQLRVNHLENTNRLLLFNYLHNFVKRLTGNRNDTIIQIITRILRLETLTPEESKILKNIKTQLGRCSRD